MKIQPLIVKLYLLLTKIESTPTHSLFIITNMAKSIHITTMRQMLKSGDPVDIKLWTKTGEIQEYRNCISLRYNFYKGTRQIKLLESREIRQVRDVCIFEINGLTVFI